MTANAMGGEPRRGRPFGVTVLAVLASISVAFGVLALTGGFGWDVSGGGWLITFAITAVGALAAYGLWNLRPWAWPLALLTWGLATIDAVFLLMNGTINTNLVVGPIVVVYLMRADIRALFRGDP